MVREKERGRRGNLDLGKLGLTEKVGTGGRVEEFEWKLCGAVVEISQVNLHVSSEGSTLAELFVALFAHER